jgi:sugar/nucleoside kinase (ribokinase family)
MIVVGLGEASVDYVHVVPRLPAAGLAKLPIRSHHIACGGQVATAMAACASLGLSAGYLGPLGADDNGRRIRTELGRRRVDLSRTIIRDAATRFAVILVDEHTGERIVMGHRDKGLDLAAADIRPALVARATVVHVDGTDLRTSIQLARLAREAGAIVTCDIDEVAPQTRELLEHVTMPVVADGVPQALTGVSDVEAALRAMRLTHGGTLCVTLGERGSAALDGETFIAVPAPQVTPVDTTGAGDVFRAGIIYGALQHWPVERMLRFANAAAAASCTRPGAIAGVPTLAEVSSLL